MTADAYLSRTDGGYRIDLHWNVPDKVQLDITAPDGKVQLDTFEVPVAQAMDAFTHTASYSKPYTRALT